MKRRTVLLACDGCGARRQGKPDVTAAQLRDALATVGWLSDGANERDLCASCLARGASL